MSIRNQIKSKSLSLILMQFDQAVIDIEDKDDGELSVGGMKYNHPSSVKRKAALEAYG